MPKKLTVSEVLDELDIMNNSDSGEEFVDDEDLDPDFDVYDEHISDNESVYTQDIHGGDTGVQGVPKKIVLINSRWRYAN
jgi:hypothetical protein